MLIATSQDLFYLVAAIALLWVAFFLCWALYEVARLFHRGNALIDMAQEKLLELEDTVMSVVDKVTNLSNYFSIFSDFARSGLSMLQSRLSGSGGDEDFELEDIPERKNKRKKK